MNDEIRPEVVQAIMDSVLDGDPRRREEVPAPSPSELARANDGIGQVLMAKTSDRPRVGEMWEILASTRFAARGLDWGGIWSALSEEQRDRLVELYDILPEPLVAIVNDYRSGEPR